jgi:hypothetical protein
VTNSAVTNFREILHQTPVVNAPATCATGDIYVDTSGAACFCTSADTWENAVATGTCI